MKVTRFRRLGLTIGTSSIGWSLLEDRPPPEFLPRVPTNGDPIATILANAEEATMAGAKSIFLYRYSPQSYGLYRVQRDGMTYRQHVALLAKAEKALRDAGYEVEFEDV